MTVSGFLDTNVLVYAVDANPAERAKRDTARILIRQDRFGTSAQVLQEFYVTVTRKLAIPLPPHSAARWVDRLTQMPFVPTDAVLVKSAIIGAQAWKIAYWDAAILCAAQALSATTVYSEDLSHGQVYGGITVINPFKI